MTRCSRCNRPWTRQVSYWPDGIVCRRCAIAMAEEMLGSAGYPETRESLKQDLSTVRMAGYVLLDVIKRGRREPVVLRPPSVES